MNNNQSSTYETTLNPNPAIFAFSGSPYFQRENVPDNNYDM